VSVRVAKSLKRLRSWCGGDTCALGWGVMGHRRWYGLKPPAAMVSGNRDVSCETDQRQKGKYERTVHFMWWSKSSTSVAYTRCAWAGGT
jgi:hypothetical protein